MAASVNNQAPLAPQLAAEAEGQAMERHKAAVSAGARAVSPALVAALREEMKQLVEGDFAGNLPQIAKLAQKAQDLFVTIRANGASMPSSMSASYAAGGVVYSGALNYGSNPEQFGARAIRELVALLPEILNANKPRATASDLMLAIDMAEAKGKTDLANKLRDKLLTQFADDDEDDHKHEDVKTTRAEIVETTAPELEIVRDEQSLSGFAVVPTPGVEIVNTTSVNAVQNGLAAVAAEAE